MRINEFNQDVRLLEIANQGRVKPQVNDKAKAGAFKDTLARQLDSTANVNFSKHASQRLYSRGIAITNDKLVQLSEAIDKAETKGSKDTLILDSNAAYVVSVPSRTIITAFDRANMQEGIFTSIDSAVIL